MISSYIEVISLTQAKNYLRIDDTLTEDDNFITSCINAAFAWMERYTNHIIKEQTKDIYASTAKECGKNVYNIYNFPIESITNDPDTFISKVYNTKVRIVSNEDPMNITFGYASVADVPEPLIQAAYAIIQVWYYNSEKTIQSNLVPDSVKFAINPYRRFPVC